MTGAQMEGSINVMCSFGDIVDPCSWCESIPGMSHGPDSWCVSIAPSGGKEIGEVLDKHQKEMERRSRLELMSDHELQQDPGIFEIKDYNPKEVCAIISKWQKTEETGGQGSKILEEVLSFVGNASSAVGFEYSYEMYWHTQYCYGGCVFLVAGH